MAVASGPGSQDIGTYPEIFIGNVPHGATAKDIREALAKYSIEADNCRIKKGRKGARFAFARLCSADDFVNALSYKNLISLQGRRLNIDRSNHSSNVVAGDPNSLAAVHLQAFCVGLYSTMKDKFLQRWKETPSTVATFTVNFQKSIMHICFTPRLGGYDYKLRMHIRDLRQVIDVPPNKVSFDRSEIRSSAIILRFSCAPEIYRQDRYDGLWEADSPFLWVRGDIEEEKDWRRTTEVAYFCGEQAIFARYFDLMLIVPDSDFRAKGTVIDRLCQRTDWGNGEENYYVPYHGREPVLDTLRVASTDDERRAMARSVPFEMLFMLEKMVGEGLMFHELLDSEFFRILRRCSCSADGVLCVRRALEHFRANWTEMTEPTAQLKEGLRLVSENSDDGRALVEREVENQREASESGKLIPVYRVTVTPLTTVFWGPELDTPNRVLRKYHHLSDRFLRVQFTDENWDRLSVGRARDEHSITELLSSVETKLGRGLNIGSRHFEFLAVSNSQLREHSCWFFASDAHTSPDVIREWMGDFSNIRSVAKYAARMGQCFSSTVTTGKLSVAPFEVEKVRDEIKTVTHHSPSSLLLGVKPVEKTYNFSDGVGMISRKFAREAAASLGLEWLPSAFQIRFAGYKGVVSLDPTLPPHLKLRLRESMHKFDSSHLKLEVVRAATYQLGHLNREIILILSALGIKDNVFLNLQRRMIADYDRATRDDTVAIQLVNTSHQAGERLLKMLNGGFSVRSEPFVQAMMLAWRHSCLKQLEEKTHIACKNAACLIGVLDESGYLTYGQVFVQVRQDDKKDGRLQRARGYVAVAKNPCLHPGDVRVLEAVFDLPKGHRLNEMVNCLVFPNNGPRPHPDECSGSDLDGDVYFVTWDPTLVPDREEMHEPMDYTAAETQCVAGSVTMGDIHKFIINYMKNDQLGSICNWHMAIADLSVLGVKDPRCIALAKQASVAVDYPKTGVPAEKKREWQPRSFPDFMKKSDKVTHTSTKVLGKLFREVQNVFNRTDISQSGAGVLMDTLADHFDQDLVVDGWEDHKEEAQDLKVIYDRELRAIMRKYNTFSEVEVIGGYLTELPRLHRRRKLHDVQGFARIDTAALWDNYYKEFLLAPPGLVGRGKQAQLEDYYLAKASAWYIVSYHRGYIHWPRQGSRGQKRYPLVSFAWVPLEYLIQLKEQSKGQRRRRLPWR